MKLMAPNSTVVDKEMNICAHHRRLFPPLWIIHQVVWRVGWFRFGGVAKLALGQWHHTSGNLGAEISPPISYFHWFLSTPNLCFPNPFPPALHVRCLFPGCDFHVVVKECVVYLIALCISCYGICETLRFLYNCRNKYWARPKKCVVFILIGFVFVQNEQGTLMSSRTMLSWSFKYTLTNPQKGLDIHG